MCKEIKVSVVCNTFNHEKYIKDALDGFVMQKTNFAFEVLIHDDASTDSTADIIREYEQKYPDIIKPIYQTQNQYSQKIPISKTFQYSRAKGKYIAFCEGDDYWTDPLKLQKQYDLMEANPDIDICAHGTQVWRNGLVDEYIKPSQTDCLFSAGEVICGTGGFVATSSLFYKAELNRNTPEFRRILSFDYTLQIQGSLNGGMLYLADCMSVYRTAVSGSWTASMRKDPLRYIKHLDRIIASLEQLNVDSCYKFKSYVDYAIFKNKSAAVYISYIYGIKLGEEEKWFKEFPIYHKSRLYLKGMLQRAKNLLKHVVRR